MWLPLLSDSSAPACRGAQTKLDYQIFPLSEGKALARAHFDIFCSPCCRPSGADASPATSHCRLTPSLRVPAFIFDPQTKRLAIQSHSPAHNMISVSNTVRTQYEELNLVSYLRHGAFFACKLERPVTPYPRTEAQNCHTLSFDSFGFHLVYVKQRCSRSRERHLLSGLLRLR